MSLVLAALGIDRRSLENPSTPISAPSDAVWEALAGGGVSEAGVAVNRERALTVAAWWRGITLIAGDVAKVGCYMRRRTKNGLALATEHPAYALLRWKPNAEQTAFTWHQVMEGNKKSHGNGYSWIDRDPAMRPQRLVLLDPSKTTPFRENGVLKYLYEPSTSGAKPRILPAQDVIHFKGWGFDGLVGYSVLAKARDALGASIAMRQHGSKYFANLARLGLILEHPATMSKEAQSRFLDSFKIAREGTDNAFRSLILEENMKAVSPPQFDAEAAQLVESRRFEVTEIANFIGVPPHKLGDMTGRTYASIEQEEQSYLSQSLDSEFVSNEQELRDKLLTEAEKASDEVVIEYDRKALVRVDATGRANYNKAALAGMPWQTIDEIRAQDGLNPLPDGEGEKLRIPINLESGAVGPEKPPAEPPPPAPTRLEGALAEVLADARGQLMRRVGAAARKASRTPSTFTDWIEDVPKAHDQAARAIFTPAAALTEALRGTPRASAIEKLAGEVLAEIRTKLERVSELAKPAELERAVDVAMSQMEEVR